ncbi:hypothetical protein DL98DRAFT_528787 [Cadophora sp. DSE1049]|nr:hypothetical protein DL98DRAFT_528787 [Cadophora sp. DSE1049]
MASALAPDSQIKLRILNKAIATWFLIVKGLPLTEELLNRKASATALNSLVSRGITDPSQALYRLVAHYATWKAYLQEEGRFPLDFPPDELSNIASQQDCLQTPVIRPIFQDLAQEMQSQLQSQSPSENIVRDPEAASNISNNFSYTSGASEARTLYDLR